MLTVPVATARLSPLPGIDIMTPKTTVRCWSVACHALAATLILIDTALRRDAGRRRFGPSVFEPGGALQTPSALAATAAAGGGLLRGQGGGATAPMPGPTRRTCRCGSARAGGSVRASAWCSRPARRLWVPHSSACTRSPATSAGWTRRREAAHALVASQLSSGGWGQTIAGPTPRSGKSWCYIADGTTGSACKAIEGNDEKNLTILDDDITQGALRFLLWFDEETGGSDADGRRDDRARAEDAGDGDLPRTGPARSAFPCATATKPIPIDVARLPQSWSRTPVKPGEGSPYYILNDQLQSDCLATFLVAERRFGGGRFLTLARPRRRLPATGAGFRSRSRAGRRPTTAISSRSGGRSFEPPSVATSETAGVIRALLELYGATGDESYRAAADQRPRAGWSGFASQTTPGPASSSSPATTRYTSRPTAR